MKLSCVIILVLKFYCLHSQFNLPFVVTQQNQYFKETKKVAKGNYTKCDITEYLIQHGNVTSEKFKSQTLLYNPNGSIKEIVNYNVRGSIISISTFNYTIKGLPTSISTFNTRGELLEKHHYKYYPSGHLKEIIKYDGYGYILMIEQIDIDTNKQKACVVKKSSPKDIISKKCYRFSNLNSGHLLKLEELNDTMFCYKTINFEYSNNKIKEKIVVYNTKKNKQQFNYRYDVNGNLLSILQTTSGRPDFEIIRYNYNTLNLRTGVFEKNIQGRIIQMKTFNFY